MGEGDELWRVEVGAQRVEQLVSHLDRGAAHRGGVLEDQLVDLGEAGGVAVVGHSQQFFVGDSPLPGDLRAEVDAVLAAHRRRRLQLGQRAVPRAEDVQLRFGLLELAVGAEQLGDVGVHPQRFEHAGRFEAGHLSEFALGEEEGDFGAQAGVAVGDSLKPGHGDPPE